VAVSKSRHLALNKELIKKLGMGKDVERSDHYIIQAFAYRKTGNKNLTTNISSYRITDQIYVIYVRSYDWLCTLHTMI
jgi:hypothetical protein